jgi:hypothetical protein
MGGVGRSCEPGCSCRRSRQSGKVFQNRKLYSSVHLATAPWSRYWPFRGQFVVSFFGSLNDRLLPSSRGAVRCEHLASLVTPPFSLLDHDHVSPRRSRLLYICITQVQSHDKQSTPPTHTHTSPSPRKPSYSAHSGWLGCTRSSTFKRASSLLFFCFFFSCCPSPSPPSCSSSMAAAAAPAPAAAASSSSAVGALMCGIRVCVRSNQKESVPCAYYAGPHHDKKGTHTHTETHRHRHTEPLTAPPPAPGWSPRQACAR